jgi:Protein of unknown function (DUF4244)
MHGPTTTPDTINATPEVVLATKPNSTISHLHLASPKSADRSTDHNSTYATSPVRSAAHKAAESAETAPTSEIDSYSTFKSPATSRALPQEPSTIASDDPTRAPKTRPQSKLRSNKWLHYAVTHRERGMSTAEYAVGTIAACAFAALLFKVVSSPEVQEMLSALIDRALKTNSG